MLIISCFVPGSIVSSTADPADVTLKTHRSFGAFPVLSGLAIHSPWSALKRSKADALEASPACAVRNVFGAAAANATARTKRLADRIAMEISSEVNSSCMDARFMSGVYVDGYLSKDESGNHQG